MEFFKYRVELKNNPKYDRLNVLVYKEIIKLLAAFIQKYMKPIQANNVFSGTIHRNTGIYVLLTKRFKQTFLDELVLLQEHLIKYIHGQGGKYLSKDAPETIVENRLNSWFSDYKEKLGEANEEYLAFVQKRLLEPMTVEESAEQFAKFFFAYEDFLMVGKRDVPLLANGYKKAGSNLDLHNWSSTIRDTFDNAEEQPWVIAAVLVFTVMILFTTFLILFFFVA